MISPFDRLEQRTYIYVKTAEFGTKRAFLINCPDIFEGQVALECPCALS